MRKCIVYLVEENGTSEFRFSFDLEMDQFYFANQQVKEIIVISPPLSIGTAQALIRCLNDGMKKRGFIIFGRRERKEEVERERIWRCQEKLGIAKVYDVFPSKGNLLEGITETRNNKRDWMCDLATSYAKWKEEIAPFVFGKQLLLDELKGIPNLVLDESFYQMLQYGILTGEVKVMSSVASPLDSARPICHRCGSSEKVHVQPCASCGDACATCEECIAMGRSKTCIPLLQFTYFGAKMIKKDHRQRDIPPTINTHCYQLTPHQARVAEYAVHFLHNQEFKELLIWAVTGAGKTEMIFPTIHKGISNGYRILLASPRKDVIRELTPRFRKAFPEIPIVSLYGGSPERWNSGQFYLATTHQTLRFVDFFDLVIIDEMDAFPYHGDSVLHRVVRRALKKDGKLIYLTATPSKDWIDRIQHREIDVTVLPIRYHGNPLPVPELKYINDLRKRLKQEKPFQIMEEFIAEVKKRKGQAFIFVSEVRLVKIWQNQLRKWFPDAKVEGVHATDYLRDDKVEQFRKGDIQFLVTTTIMERGVTVPNVHVLVLGADTQVFDEATLVQIAGRVGRSKDYPDGLVWFIAETKTKDLVKAKDQIERMNQLAKNWINNKK
ncbi:DEAD/DEAH box helicase [Tepidibacillus fermentans]|uniref:Competence protein ComFA n=1 Tax=Tepidibacillus fermentans TaxID=1281767 RepID=A0A4R3KIG4_9BACI|nr:helicase-related protein [Tepidibacillus fermentans]TCS83328.1 competence protein ComFA [Tepidibacillus fermentans]